MPLFAWQIKKQQSLLSTLAHVNKMQQQINEGDYKIAKKVKTSTEKNSPETCCSIENVGLKEFKGVS